MLKIVLSCLLVMIISNARADYHVGFYNNLGAINVNLPTRILVVGTGDDLGLLFEEVAKAKAVKYVENNPTEQILIIAAVEKKMDSASALKRFGFSITKTDRATLDGGEFVKEVSRYKKILSLDIFSHSSAQHGIHLDTKINHINNKTAGLAELRGNFMKDAYVFLHGCNTGFSLAPFLSKNWGIPVAGSLTSTNFQRLHSDGNFYLSEEGFAPNTDWARTNALSYNESLACSSGICQRLKPDNTPYVGFWGAYREGGLPFYKIFCANNSTESCMKAMAKTMLSHTLIVNLKKSSTLAEYKKGVVDFLCPISSQKDLRGECAAKLEEALITQDMTYNPFSRALIECDFKGCQAEVTCQKILFTTRPGTCTLRNDAKSPATTMAREYKAYLQAYPYLAQ